MVEFFLIVLGWWSGTDGTQVIDSPAIPSSPPVLLAEAQELQHSREMAERLAKVAEEVDKDDLDSIY